MTRQSTRIGTQSEYLRASRGTAVVAKRDLRLARQVPDRRFGFTSDFGHEGRAELQMVQLRALSAENGPARSRWAADQVAAS